jgi:hypothetical protein
MAKIRVFNGTNARLEREISSSPCIIVDLTRQGGKTKHFEDEFHVKSSNSSLLRIVHGIHRKSLENIVEEVKGHAEKFEQNDRKPKVYVFGYHENVFALTKMLKQRDRIDGVIVSALQLEHLGKAGQEARLALLLKKEL